jgi:hypothetical protein
MLEPSNEKNKPTDHKSSKDDQPDSQSSPESKLGEKLIDCTYVASVQTSQGEESFISAGTMALHEAGIQGRETLDKDMLEILNVRSAEEAERALRGDGGEPQSSSTKVGYNSKYAAGWNALWGPSSN